MKAIFIPTQVVSENKSEVLTTAMASVIRLGWVCLHYAMMGKLIEKWLSPDSRQ